MIFWEPFEHDGIVYDLSHLHPTQIELIQPGIGGNPERCFAIQVIFSLHCFTRSLKGSEASEIEHLIYRDRREDRVFDFGRYELSKRLPEIVKAIDRRACFHSGKGNFFLIELLTSEGQRQEYEVYFEASRSGKRGGLINLYVQSAYVRDASHKSSQPKKKKIGLFVILHNIQNNKPIRAPK